jgi:hypothetical protein
VQKQEDPLTMAVIRELLRSLKVKTAQVSEISPDSEVSELARLQK